MSRKKKPPSRRVTVTVPSATFALLSLVADARGADLSSLVNAVLADAMPELGRWLKEFRAATASREGDAPSD